MAAASPSLGERGSGGGSVLVRQVWPSEEFLRRAVGPCLKRLMGLIRCLLEGCGSTVALELPESNNVTSCCSTGGGGTKEAVVKVAHTSIRCVLREISRLWGE